MRKSPASTSRTVSRRVRHHPNPAFPEKDGSNGTERLSVITSKVNTNAHSRGRSFEGALIRGGAHSRGRSFEGALIEGGIAGDRGGHAGFATFLGMQFDAKRDWLPAGRSLGEGGLKAGALRPALFFGSSAESVGRFWCEIRICGSNHGRFA